MRTLRHVVFVSIVALFLALSLGFSGQAPARNDAAAPAKAPEPQQQSPDQTRALDHLTGRVDAMERSLNAAAIAGQAACQSADLTIKVVGFLFTLVAAGAAVFAFLGYRSVKDLIDKAGAQFAAMADQAQKHTNEAEQSAMSAGKSAKIADEYVKRMDTFFRQTEEKARSFASLDPTKDMTPVLKQQLEDFGRRLELFEALGLPLDAQACLARGNDYFSREDYAAALACYDRALELKPDNARAHGNRGAALGRLGRNGEALAACDRALELRPDDADTHCNRGAALLRLDRSDEALAACDRALEIEPNHDTARYNRACAFARLGRRDDVLADLREAVRLDPRFRDKAGADSDFESLRSDPDFRTLVGLDGQPPA